MKITIIGAGNVGATLGQKFADAGHSVNFGVRSPDKHTAGSLAGPVSAVAESASDTDAILLAVPFDAASAALTECGDLTGKIIIDATNPLGTGDEGLYLTMGYDESGAERIAKHARGAHLVKCFNSTSFMNMADPRGSMMFVCGDDAASSEVVLNLSNEIGFDTINIGALKQSRLLEPLAMLFIHLAFTTELKWDFALNIERKMS